MTYLAQRKMGSVTVNFGFHGLKCDFGLLCHCPGMLFLSHRDCSVALV